MLICDYFDFYQYLPGKWPVFDTQITQKTVIYIEINNLQNIVSKVYFSTPANLTSFLIIHTITTNQIYSPSNHQVRKTDNNHE